MTTVEMRVHMDCPGCQSKIRKALKKLDGVDNIDIDMEMQKVTVIGWTEEEKVLKTVRKTGRTAELWPFPYDPEHHNYMSHYYDTFYSRPDTSYSQPSSSSYNYQEHGYNGHAQSYFHAPPYTTIIDERTKHMFSDDNATGCSIM